MTALSFLELKSVYLQIYILLQDYKYLCYKQ